MAKFDLIFERAVYGLLDSNPFYANMLMLVRRQFTDDDSTIPTAAITFTNPPILIINKNFFAKITAREQEGTLEHELLHLVMRHDNKRFNPNYYSDFSLVNIACDLAINQLIQDGKLIKEAVTIEKFELAPDQTSEWYYEKLKEKKKSGERKLKKLLEAAKEATKGHILPGGLSDIEVDLAIEGVIREAYGKAMQHPKGIGNLPGKVKSIIESILAPAKVHWTKELRRFRASLGRARLRYTIKRESKRFGTIPGTKIKSACLVLVAIDTSGSVTNDDLKLFANEIRHMKRNGAEIEVMEVDARVHRVYRYRNKIPGVMGRGGTDMREIFNWIKQSRRMYDGIIVLTDGYTPMFERQPLPITTLWVINRGKKCAEWGRTITIDA
jgi:predicted metal-dependent peptidase